MSYRLEQVNPEILKEFEGNPRKHTETTINKLEKSFDKFGVISPVVALSKTKEILAGHARIKTAIKTGLKEVPVIFVDMPRKDAMAYIIADNKIQEDSLWDYPALKDMIAEIDDGSFDIEVTGFDMKAIETIFNNVKTELEFIEGNNDTELSDSDKVKEISGQSNIKMLQLYFSMVDFDRISDMCKDLMPKYKIDNLTDVIMKAVENEHSRNA